MCQLPGQIRENGRDARVRGQHLDQSIAAPIVLDQDVVGLHQPGTDRVLSIELVGPVTALARLRCSIAPKHFIDLLTLLWLDGRWQIVSKVFHYDIRG